MLTVKNYQIQDKQLSGLRIVVVGDWHIKSNQQKRLKKVIKAISIQKPDMVLSVGDFVSGHNLKKTMPIENIAVQLKQITVPFYTVLGNHDWWQNGGIITKELEKNNIKVLANSNIKLKIKNKIVYIAGVEDLMTRGVDIDRALIETTQPIILLTHSPDIFKDIPKQVNLTIAGHVHGGQVRLPFIGAVIIPSKYGNKYSQGLIEKDKKKMIVTKGIGNSILNVRFNCVPEIVVIDFK